MRGSVRGGRRAGGRARLWSALALAAGVGWRRPASAQRAGGPARAATRVIRDRGSAAAVTGLAVHGDRLAVTREHPDGRLYLYSLRTGARLGTVEQGGGAFSPRPVFSADGALLACGNAVHVVRGGEVRSPGVEAHALAFSGDGGRLAAVRVSRLEIVDVASASVAAVHPLPPPVPPSASYDPRVAWSPDGSRVAVAYGRSLHVVDARSGLRRDREPPLPQGGANWLSWADGGRIVAEMADACVREIDAETLAQTRELCLDLPRGGFLFARSPAGLMAAGNEREVRVFSVDGALRVTIGTAGARSVAFAGDDALVVGREDGSVTVHRLGPAAPAAVAPRGG